MWNLQTEDYKEGTESVYVVRQVPQPEEHDWVSYRVPSSRQASRPITRSSYNVDGELGIIRDGEFTIVTEAVDEPRRNTYAQWNNKTHSLPVRTTVPATRPHSGLSQQAFMRHIKTFQNGNVKMVDEDQEETEGNEEEKQYDKNMLHGHKGPIFLACFVRFMLIAHNVLTVWRVTDSYRENMYWLMVIANFFLILEGMVVIIKRAGMEYSWWCPCFLIYLASTIPAIWLLQLNQYDRFANPDKWTTLSPVIATIPTTASSVTSVMTTVLGGGNVSNDSGLTTALTATIVPVILDNVTSDVTNASVLNTTMATTPVVSEPVVGTFDNDVWVIIIEESLVYLLVFARWLLPRGRVSRDFLADLILEFLAIASDIMELLAVFDEDQVRGNLHLTYAIMAVWSASFIQFIPILMQRKRFRKTRNVNNGFLTRYCGDKFVEIVVTCMSVFLQDLPFLVVRLYIIIEVKLITYSLIFFLLKNIVTLLLLFYRLTVLCYRLPHCKGKPA